MHFSRFTCQCTGCYLPCYLPVAVQKRSLPFLLPFSCAQYCTRNLRENNVYSLACTHNFSDFTMLSAIISCYLPGKMLSATHSHKPHTSSSCQLSLLLLRSGRACRTYIYLYLYF